MQGYFAALSATLSSLSPSLSLSLSLSTPLQAELCAEPQDVFRYMDDWKIGTELALFYKVGYGGYG